MRTKKFIGMISFILVALISCKDEERSGETDIMSAEEKEIQTESETERYALLDSIREDEDLSMFSEGLGNTGFSPRMDVPEGPHTIFAPVNTAYDRLSPSERIEMDEARVQGNRELYEYYIVDGEVTTDWLKQEWDRRKGTFPLETRQGQSLMVDKEGENFILKDATGREARIIQEDRYGATGVVQRIDNVLMPGKMEDTLNQQQ